VAAPLLHSGIANGVFDFPCDVYELRAASRFYSKRFHAVNRELWNGNNEVRTNVFDSGMAFDLFKALLAPAGGERKKTQFTRLQRLVRVQKIGKKFFVGRKHVELGVKRPPIFSCNFSV
jgi:hypothetical protein